MNVKYLNILSDIIFGEEPNSLNYKYSNLWRHFGRDTGYRNDNTLDTQNILHGISTRKHCRW